METLQRKTYWKKQLRSLRQQRFVRRFYPGCTIKKEGSDRTIYTDIKFAGLRKCISHWIIFNGGKIILFGPEYWGDVVRLTSDGSLKYYKQHKIICAIINGARVTIEVDRELFSLTPINGNFIQQADTHELYFIARDMQSFVNWYKATFPIKKQQNSMAA